MSKKAGKIALGLGLITGAVTGLLFAPEEGKKIRNKIQKGDTKGLLHDLQMMGEEIRDMAVEISKNPKVTDAMNSAKNKTAEMANMKREELDKFLKNATQKAEAIKKKAEKFVKEQKATMTKSAPKKGKKTVRKKSAPKRKSTKPKSTTPKA